ncbi:MAG TPA: YggU family protein [Thermoplasmatales archaeon]|nr:YggU family protein [Thermoplasmatales archaeon]
MSIEESIQDIEDGIILKLYVSPNKKKNVFPAGYNKWRKSIEVHVTEPAQDNKANREVVKVVSKFFDTPENDVKIISGKTSKEKKVEVVSITKEKALDKLRGAFNEL